ncbi:MAG TPA: MotA/TolQ/ExbB proton channel family protein [Gammaproteobacteria bacterium]|nr:MotA/TolQ/ExbB proton channel family protein [Gammaproteobacteria bacterium]
MIWFTEFFVTIRDFFEAGGWVLYGLFFVTVLMWTFILERLWYFYAIHPDKVEEARRLWDKREDTTSWYAKRIREKIVSEIAVSAERFVPMVRTCILVAPLLGLLGTVTGMILVFASMTQFGTGNPRAMADGVSHATIPTMAGMVTALSGLYFAQYLEKKVRREVENVEDVLVHH